jgi:hypothetical protein
VFRLLNISSNFPISSDNQFCSCQATSPLAQGKEESNLQILGPAGEITAGKDLPNHLIWKDAVLQKGLLVFNLFYKVFSQCLFHM